MTEVKKKEQFSKKKKGKREKENLCLFIIKQNALIYPQEM
jgi:hypothetical protein